MALTGYPARDLLLEPAFIARTREVAETAGARSRRDRAGARRPADREPVARRAAAVERRGAPAWRRDRARLRQEPAADLRRLRRGPLLRAGPGLEALGDWRLVAPRSASARTSGTIATSGSGRATWPTRSTPSSASAPRVLLNLSASPFSAGKQRGARGDAGRAGAEPRRPRRLRQPGRRQRRSDLRRPQRRARPRWPRHRARAGVRGGGRRRRSRRSRRPTPSHADVAGEEEIFRGAGPRHRRLRAQVRLHARRCSGCPAASTRRSPRSSPRGAGPRQRHRRADAVALLEPGQPRRFAGAGRARSASAR